MFAGPHHYYCGPLQVTAVVTWPFPFEARRRIQQARRGMTAMKCYVNQLIVVRLRELMPLPPRTRFKDVFEMADKKAARAVIDTMRANGTTAMECDASGGSLIGCCVFGLIG